MDDIKFDIIEDPGEEVVALVKKGLREYDIQSKHGKEIDNGSVFLSLQKEDKDIATSLCHYRGDWLVIHALWINEDYRSKGLGKKLLEAIEAIARDKSLKGLIVMVTELQNPEFYLHEGFEEFGRLDGYAGDYARLYLKKEVK